MRNNGLFLLSFHSCEPVPRASGRVERRDGEDCQGRQPEHSDGAISSSYDESGFSGAGSISTSTLTQHTSTQSNPWIRKSYHKMPPAEVRTHGLGQHGPGLVHIRSGVAYGIAGSVEGRAGLTELVGDTVRLTSKTHCRHREIEEGGLPSLDPPDQHLQEQLRRQVLLSCFVSGRDLEIAWDV
jgi:hypothetical protein